MARSGLSKEYVEDSASETESSATEEVSKNSKIPLSKQPKDFGPSDDASESSEDSSVSGSEDGMSDAESNTSPDNSATNQRKRKSKSQQHMPSNKKARSTPSYIPARAYQPPAGFGPLKSETQSATLTSADLKSKQVWHLTAPASVPLRKIKSFNLQASLRGEPVLEYQGIKYNLQPISMESDTLLLPIANPVSTGRGSEVTTAYETSNAPVTRTLHLRETSSSLTQNHSGLQNDSSTSYDQRFAETVPDETNFFATELGTKPNPRKQPQGLMMRYHPFGSHHVGKEKMHSTEEETSTSDEESPANLTNGFAVPPVASEDEMQIDISPRSVKKTKPDKKGRREDHLNGTESLKKSKKEKRISKEESGQPPEKPAMVNGDNSDQIFASQKDRKEKKKDKHRKREKVRDKA